MAIIPSTDVDVVVWTRTPRTRRGLECERARSRETKKRHRQDTSRHAEVGERQNSGGTVWPSTASKISAQWVKRKWLTARHVNSCTPSPPPACVHAHRMVCILCAQFFRCKSFKLIGMDGSNFHRTDYSFWKSAGGPVPKELAG